PLHPLTQAQISHLVSYLPKNLIPIIQTQSAGNPFFAEELARFISPHPNDQLQLDTFPFTSSLAGVGLVPTQTVPTSSDLPDAIAAVVERRLHRLSDECHTLLGKAAVLGDSFELKHLLPMDPEYNEDTMLDLLEEALHAGLL